MTKKRGLMSDITRMKCRNRLPLGSVRDSRLPTVLKLWQHGPPVTKHTSFRVSPALRKISLEVTSSIGRSIVESLGRFFLSVAIAERFTSTATAVRKPADSNPKSKPIAPENKETILLSVVMGTDAIKSSSQGPP